MAGLRLHPRTAGLAGFAAAVALLPLLKRQNSM